MFSGFVSKSGSKITGFVGLPSRIVCISSLCLDSTSNLLLVLTTFRFTLKIKLDIILIIDAIKELKLMVHAYYPLENKILELLTKKNLRKFELDILNKQFFQQDIEDFNRDIEENCLNYEDDLTEYGRKLFDKYGLDPYEFNKEVIAAVQKLQDRKIISLNGCTYSISFGVWHYHMFWLKRIYSFFGTKFDNLRKKLRLKYRNFKKFIDKVLFDIKDKFKSLLENLLNVINKIFNKNKTM